MEGGEESLIVGSDFKMDFKEDSCRAPAWQATISTFQHNLEESDVNMDFIEDSCSSSAWQATIPTFLRNLANKWQEAANTSISHCQQEPKKLTTEALCVLCVILFVVILCLIGSSINAYESLRKAFSKKISQKLIRHTSNGNKETQTAEENKEDENSPISDSRGNFRKFIDCFCFQTNASKILSIHSEQEHLNCIDGIRAIMFLWVFITHFFGYLSSAIKNFDKKLHIIEGMPITKFAAHAPFGIDSFVVLSGFLTAYLFSNYYEKNKGKIPWISFYAIRFLKVTPVYMAVLAFYSTLFTYVGSSPIWPTYNTNPVCKENWIWNLLYINNFFSYYKQCMTMTWFLACVMQLYVISPLFLIPLNRWPKVGYFLSVVAIGCSCYASFVITKKYNLFAILPKLAPFDVIFNRMWQNMDELFQKTYVKLTPYLVGLLLGHYLHKRTLSQKSNLLTLFFGGFMSATSMLICFFALHNREESVWEAAVYNSVKSLLFSCSFSWIVFLCATQQAGSFGKFISCPIFKPICRLSFCAYLTQTIVIEAYLLSVDLFEEEIDISTGLLGNLAWVPVFGNLFLWTLVSAFVVSVLFEYPVIRLLQTYFSEKKKTHSEK